MSKKIALLVGLTEVDATSPVYDGWDGRNGCSGCENDVRNISDILQSLRYGITTLVTQQATAQNVLESLRNSVSSLEKEDIFVFYFSGHGGQQPALDTHEPDGKDETLVTYDRPIVDNELYDIWMNAATGARVIMISDSCNSGSNYRRRTGEKSSYVYRASMPFVPMQARNVRSATPLQMIHLGGCRDGFTSIGYDEGGAFTSALRKVWDDGRFDGNYKKFFEKVKEMILSTQVPVYNEFGSVSAEFRNSKPFTAGGKTMSKTIALRTHDGRYVGITEAGDCVLSSDIDLNETFEVVEINSESNSVGEGRQQEIVYEKTCSHYDNDQDWNPAETGRGSDTHQFTIPNGKQFARYSVDI